MSNDTPTPLKETIKGHELASRHSRINLIEQSDDSEQRIAEAQDLIRYLAMQRVFDQFSREEEVALFDRLWPIAYPDDDRPCPPLFGTGATTKV